MRLPVSRDHFDDMKAQYETRLTQKDAELADLRANVGELQAAMLDLSTKILDGGVKMPAAEVDPEDTPHVIPFEERPSLKTIRSMASESRSQAGSSAVKRA